ncbi:MULTISPECIES: D-ribose pyranase [Paenibacillus]|uniref:D-ribose pyranase n=1 Tax=Paenibacillus campinasensis TaxID=66347 RepID=A0A268F3K5_9BACL|nr:D-ribose pyranase [Paenibacillus campinasensis]MUG64822.1 D-ribose pyranase [Paenibacillus campinasensis]PAD79952.1 D-ribose pyranase [Paenibacillus campinasensis]
MKKQGILNSHIAKVLADLGHTDTIVVGDVGLPVPPGVLKIDLAIKHGQPSFRDVVDAIAEDMVVEKVIVAEEIHAANAETLQYIHNRFQHCDIDACPHEELKQQMATAKAVIRTGEAKPYANCILQAGVHFG